MKPIRAIAVLAAMFAAGPASAADVDPNIPADTEVVLSINLEELLNSPLGKKYLRASVAEAVRADDRREQALKSLGLDPLRDLTRVTICLSSATAERGFLIVNGRFNRSRIADHAERVAAEYKDRLKIHKHGDVTLYEVPGDKPMFARLVSDSTLLVATERESVAEAGKRGGPKKELAGLIRQADDKQSGWLVLLAGGTSMFPVPEAQKQAMEKVEGVIGTLKVQTSARLEVSILTPDPQVAAAVNAVISEFLTTAKNYGAQAVKEKPDLAPLVELVGATHTAVRGKTVHVAAELSAAQIDKVIKAVRADR